MDKLKEMLEMDPCYEQHIVSIKNIYEQYLFSILAPAMYEGFQSLYKRAYEIEKKFIAASKKNPTVENPGILVLFQTLLKDIPNLNTHKIRIETDRIKSSSKSADVFDDLVKAVCKSNIILLTYNVDHKRAVLLQTKYHESIIVHDFVHTCYVECARVFFCCSELFYHKYEPIVLNKNKRECYAIIKEAIQEAIRIMLPMKEILLEYNTQKYEQKEKNYFVPTGYTNINNLPAYPYPPGQDTSDEYIDANTMLNRDLSRYGRYTDHSLLEDDYEPEDENNEDEDEEDAEFGPNPNQNGDKDYSLLLEGGSESDSAINTDKPSKDKGQDSLIDDGESSKTGSNQHPKDSIEDNVSVNSNTSKSDKGDTPPVGTTDKDKDQRGGEKNGEQPNNYGLKMIDISGATHNKRGAASTYFNETMPDIKRRFEEYKKEKKIDTPPNTNSNDKKDSSVKPTKKDSPENDIQITRSTQSASIHSDITGSAPVDSVQKKSKDKKTEKDLDKLADDILKT
jgi:hypothetical protein